MNLAQVVPLFLARIEAQPHDTRSVPLADRDALIVSCVEVDGQWVVLSRYGEDKWRLTGATTNAHPSASILDFAAVPRVYRSTLKAVVYRYLRRGRDSGGRPGVSAARNFLCGLMPFVRHLARLQIHSLRAVTPMVCAVYVAECKAHRNKKGKPLGAAGLISRYEAVEALFDLSQYTDDPIRTHPWPASSAKHMAGLTGAAAQHLRRGTTPLIPDDAFTALFKAAWALVQRGHELLALRDALDKIAAKRSRQGRTAIHTHSNRYLESKGWVGGIRTHSRELIELRTACYIVIASVSGCRNHELAFIQSNACYRTEDDEGETYCWMRSQSTKTGEGHTAWMIPLAAETALGVMDRWAKPLQTAIAVEIDARRAANPGDVEIAEALRHQNAVFLGKDASESNRARTLSNQSWRHALRAFAKKHRIKWRLSPHQFRRKFANYAARSQFGDLRYLREHFKHWSLDMTLGYALNESQEMALYLEIEEELNDIKEGVAENWLTEGNTLAGGYGRSIMAWRGTREVTLFKDRRTMVRSVAESTAIRSNGHAWCTADDNLCVGNGGLEVTRCTDCNNAVIGAIHARVYQRLYDDLKDMLAYDDIGESGLARVRRDMKRCREVIVSLGYDPEARAA